MGSLSCVRARYIQSFKITQFLKKKEMFFKGNVSVNNKTIKERIAIRTKMAAPADVWIGQIALQNLLEASAIDSSRINLFIGATNVGGDKYGPRSLLATRFTKFAGLVLRL